jgi:hypothetical protein
MVWQLRCITAGRFAWLHDDRTPRHWALPGLGTTDAMKRRTPACGGAGRAVVKTHLARFRLANGRESESIVIKAARVGWLEAMRNKYTCT